MAETDVLPASSSSARNRPLLSKPAICPWLNGLESLLSALPGAVKSFNAILAASQGRRAGQAPDVRRPFWPIDHEKGGSLSAPAPCRDAGL
ncbi:MAG: hypothetical protein ACOYO0_13250, partial [Sandarakinorhabdus sp.]